MDVTIKLNLKLLECVGAQASLLCGRCTTDIVSAPPTSGRSTSRQGTTVAPAANPPSTRGPAGQESPTSGQRIGCG
jgi:hypothetical protein